MFGKKNTDTPAVERVVAQGVSFELTLAERAKRSEKRAWLVAWSAVLMSLILAGGYFLFLPLKEKVPYLVMADPYTGTASVARLVGDFENRDVTATEAINKSNVANFILARESYDSGLIGQRNWRTALSMAGPAVSPAYIALHSESNPDRPFRVYGSGKALHVRILSIVLIGGGDGSRPSGATVRFQRNVYDKGTGRSEPLDNKIATMEFAYDQDLRLNDEDRLLNPLGFRVVNYRVDNDFAPSAASPGVAEMVPAMQQPQMAAAPMDPNMTAMGQQGTTPGAPLPTMPAEQMEGVGGQGERE
ncbi:type IV secretion system protein [Luteimonas fraxinea]|uniref:Type IV secretion system protein n=1 Tax=Luteimonas fraxinea TaxID=2901869 RepID=A0ABS8UF36_9GAMM|nr:type IV secretion system protein [Luteimonas fraxinea]MCD9098115.1 type IV secretion system protein [Luteimonas fraxinea]MCD9125354.1 type IV secretion system protein [Luteimonas fraxinea]UHH09159.1 type IV secretion system protein [Luteimonas fraxinea]